MAPAVGRSQFLWTESWAVEASVQAAAIRAQVNVALRVEPRQPRRQAAAAEIEKLLSLVDEATRRRSRWQLKNPLDWWRGTRVEQAYQSLHAAKVVLVDIISSEDLHARVPSVLAKLETCLPPDDVRRLKFETLIRPRPDPRLIRPLDDQASPVPPRSRTDLARRVELKQRAELKQAMEIAYDGSDQAHTRVRGFRNVLLAAAGLIALFMVALVFVVYRHPEGMPLCFTPSITAPLASSGDLPTRRVCPSGEDPLQTTPLAAADRQTPQPADVLIVAGLGLLGGALAAAFSIRKLRGSSTPYGVPIAVAWLKVPTGSLTAVAGIILLGGGFVPGLSELDSQRQILAYALVFGYAQQIATRLIDDRAQSLLDSVPSQDMEGNQPTQPTRGELPVTDAVPVMDDAADHRTIDIPPRSSTEASPVPEPAAAAASATRPEGT